MADSTHIRGSEERKEVGCAESEQPAEPADAATTAATTAATPATPAGRPKLLGTANYAPDTLGCVLAFLDTVGLAVVANTSRAHLHFLLRFVAGMREAFVQRKVGDRQADIRLSRQATRLLSLHARNLERLTVVPRKDSADTARATDPESMDNRDVYIGDLAHADLTAIRNMLPEIVAKNAATLRRVWIPPHLYSSDILAALGRCRALAGIDLFSLNRSDLTAKDQCAHILRQNQATLATLTVRGLAWEAIAPALTHSPLTTLSFSHVPHAVRDLTILGACTGLVHLSVHTELTPLGMLVSWRESYQQLAVALPKLTRLRTLALDPQQGTDVSGILWSFAPTLQHLHLAGQASFVPRIAAPGAGSLQIRSASPAELVQLAMGLPRLTSVHVQTLGHHLPRIVKNAIRDAAFAGVFKRLRVARLCGVDDEVSYLSLGGDTLCALAAGCPRLVVLDAHVHASFSVAHLERLLLALGRVRFLKLAFSPEAIETRSIDAAQLKSATEEILAATAAPAAMPVAMPAATTPIVLPHLVVLRVPVCSDGFLRRLVCRRIEKLDLDTYPGGVTHWPRAMAPSMRELRIRLDAAACTPPPDTKWRRLGTLYVDLGDFDAFPAPLFFAMLRAFTGVTRLQMIGSIGLAIFDALASPDCPPSRLVSIFVDGNLVPRFDRPPDEPAKIAAAHPRLALLQLPFGNLDLGASQRFRAVGIRLLRQSNPA